MDDKFVVQFEADIAKWQSDLETVKKSIADFRSGVLTADDAIDKIGASVGGTSREMREAASSVKEVDSATRRATTATRGWAESLSGRWAQDFQRQMGTLPSQIRASEQAIRSLNKSMLESNLSWLPGQGTAPRTGASFGNIVDQDAKSAEQASRSYLNLSTSMDGAIEARQRESQQFSQSLKARLQENEAIGETTQNLSTQRYALYDVAASYGAISAGLLGLSAATLKVGADFETAFTHVERTLEKGMTRDQIAALESDLVDLSTQIPLTFAEISEIATLGNQLGIAADDITAFTETVAQFSTIAGMTVEETALAFGQLGNLLGVPAEDFHRLGSAIALVGVNSAATEKQIVSVAREIAPAARAAGFSAEQVVGLSGALASIRVPPERSRSTMLQFFETLNTSVAAGGQSLEDFATVIGVTSQELDQMVRAGRGEDILRRFIGTLESSDTIEITQALDRLNLAGLRVNPTIRALSDNTALMNQTFADSAVGWQEGTEQAVQFGLIVDNLASQFQMFINAINALIVELTGGLVPGIAGVLSVGVDFVNMMRDLAQNDAVQTMAQFTVVLAGAFGAMAALRAMSALTAASTIALAQAQAAVGGTGVLRSLNLFTAALFGHTKIVDGAVIATWSLRTATLAFMRATLILGVIALVTELIFNFAGSMQWAAQAALDVAGVVYPLANSFADFLITVGNALGFFGQQAVVFGTVLKNNIAAGEAALDHFSDWANSLGGAEAPTNDLSDSALNLMNSLGAMGGAALGSAGDLGKLGNSAGEAAKELRTAADYASDLSSVFGRAFEIQFGPQTAMDSLTLKWIELNEQMRDYRAEVARLTADRAVKEYFLSIAEAYDDQLRAGQLRADILEIDGKLADAQANVSRETVGNSKAAIQNRGTLQDLVKQYGDYITALSASGASADELNAAVAQSVTEFRAQAQSLGFSEAQITPYISSIRGLITIIGQIPPVNVSITGLSAAEAAVREFIARARSAVGGGINVPVTSVVNNAALIAQAQREYDAERARINALVGTNYAPNSSMFANLNSLYQRLLTLQRGWKSGGYTGNGGTSAPAGVVHGKEFVFNAQATRNAGVGNLYGMMRAFEQGRGYQTGGFVGAAPTAPAGTGMMVELSPTDRRLLAAAGNVTLTLDGRIVADSTNGINGVYAKRGA